MSIRHLIAVSATAVLMSSTCVQADPTPKFMTQEAAGLLHHSCDSLVEVTNEDEDAIVSVVRKMVAVSLINRQIDLSKHVTSDEHGEELRAKFIELVRDGCDADRKAVLVGIVDNAVKNTLGL